MELTPDQIKSFDHISTDEIKVDLADTESEVTDYYDELKILNRNPPENRLRIYLIEGHLIQHNELIDKLKQILTFREGDKQ